MLPAPLRLSLLLDGCICHFGFLVQTSFFKWWRFKVRWRRRRWQRRTAAAAATPSWYFLDADGARGSPRPEEDVSCAEAPPLPVPWRPEKNDRGLAPIAHALQWSSMKLLPCGNGTVLNDPPLVCDLLLHLHIQGNFLCTQTPQSRFGAMALVALAEIRAPMEVEELPHVVAKQAL